jgi:hypothetical protein
LQSLISFLGTQLVRGHQSQFIVHECEEPVGRIQRTWTVSNLPQDFSQAFSMIHDDKHIPVCEEIGNRE